MIAYYNENESYAADWLGNLVKAGHIAPGSIDSRSIRDLTPFSLGGYDQCHFFAGIGVWSYALKLAGFPTGIRTWTGSCPCQPFSVAGKRGGITDDRHLWPVWFDLIRECRPTVVFGEQVSSPDGLKWFDAVSADLENAGYAVAALDTCGPSCGAPHIRQRLYFGAYDTRGALADTAVQGRARGRSGEAGNGSGASWLESGRRGFVGGLAHHHHQGLGLERGPGLSQDRDAPHGHDAHGCRTTNGEPVVGACPVANADDPRSQGRVLGGNGSDQRASGPGGVVSPGPVNGFWADAEWIPCLDGKLRPIEPRTFALVDGSAFKLDASGPLAGKSRTGLLKAYGNALIAPVAATFVRAFMDATGIKPNS